MSRRRTIRVRWGTMQRLKALLREGESYDKLISRLLRMEEEERCRES